MLWPYALPFGAPGRTAPDRRGIFSVRIHCVDAEDTRSTGVGSSRSGSLPISGPLEEEDKPEACLAVDMAAADAAARALHMRKFSESKTGRSVSWLDCPRKLRRKTSTDHSTPVGSIGVFGRYFRDKDGKGAGKGKGNHG